MRDQLRRRVLSNYHQSGTGRGRENRQGVEASFLILLPLQSQFNTGVSLPHECHIKVYDLSGELNQLRRKRIHVRKDTHFAHTQNKNGHLLSPELSLGLCFWSSWYVLFSYNPPTYRYIKSYVRLYVIALLSTLEFHFPHTLETYIYINICTRYIVIYNKKACIL